MENYGSSCNRPNFCVRWHQRTIHVSPNYLIAPLKSAYKLQLHSVALCIISNIIWYNRNNEIKCQKPSFISTIYVAAKCYLIKLEHEIFMPISYLNLNISAKLESLSIESMRIRTVSSIWPNWKIGFHLHNGDTLKTMWIDNGNNIIQKMLTNYIGRWVL